MQITRFLRRMGFSQTDLAKKLNCSTTLVASWVSGRAKPSYEKCKDLVGLGMTIGELFEKEAEYNMEDGLTPEFEKLFRICFHRLIKK